MIVVIERDYYGDIVDIYGPFNNEREAEQFMADRGLSTWRSEIFMLTSPRRK